MRTQRLIRSRLLILLVIGLMTFVACGGGDDDDDGGDDATATSPPATEAAASGNATSAGADESTEAPTADAGSSDEQVTLRLGVSMTPPELETFEAGLDAIRERHPNWEIVLEQTPQDGIVEKINSQIASDQLPDVQQIQGLFAQPWIRQGAFADLTEMAEAGGFDVDDFWPGALDQFRFEERLYAIPNIVAPDLVYINTAMFDEAGVEYPTDDWTLEDLREIALELTLDSEGRNANDADFDPNSVVQWGLSVAPNGIWARHYLLPFGADPCANEDCTEVAFSDPEVQEALQWWADLVQAGAAPYDPYTGNQTGVPGEGFQAGIAAMGINGFFLVGQLNATGGIEYDVVEPPAGVKASPLSTNGWVIAETSQNKEAAWELIQELSSPEFLAEYWAQPGHGVPARQSAAEAILNPDAPPANQQAILDSLAYAEVFYPNTAGAFEAYGRTTDIFISMMKGDTSIEEGTAEIDTIVNEVLAADRGE